MCAATVCCHRICGSRGAKRGGGLRKPPWATNRQLQILRSPVRPQPLLLLLRPCIHLLPHRLLLTRTASPSPLLLVKCSSSSLSSSCAHYGALFHSCYFFGAIFSVSVSVGSVSCPPPPSTDSLAGPFPPTLVLLLFVLLFLALLPHPILIACAARLPSHTRLCVNIICEGRRASSSGAPKHTRRDGLDWQETCAVLESCVGLKVTNFPCRPACAYPQVRSAVGPPLHLPSRHDR